MAREEVRIMDAIVAVMLMESAMESALGNTCDPTHGLFPPDPTENYRKEAEAMLDKLELNHLWPPERLRLDRARERHVASQVTPT